MRRVIERNFTNKEYCTIMGVMGSTTEPLFNDENKKFLRHGRLVFEMTPSACNNE